MLEMDPFLFDAGAVEGQLDYRVSEGGKRIDFSWSGNDEGDKKSGRGWFKLSSSRIAKGRFFIHCGDESAVEMELQT